MRQTITLSDFRDAFKRMGREYHFTYEGLETLYNHLEAINPDYELDVIALCCDYTELSLEEILSDYDLESRDELEDNTLVLDVACRDTVIIQDF